MGLAHLFHRESDPPLTIIERPALKVSSEQPPVNSSEPPATAKVRRLHKRSKPSELATCIGPGQWRVTLPADWEGDLTSDLYDALNLLAVEHMATGKWPEAETREPKQELIFEQRTAARIEQLQTVATSQRDLDRLLDNEGIPRGPIWQEPSEAVAKERATAWLKRQIDGLARAVQLR